MEILEALNSLIDQSDPDVRFFFIIIIMKSSSGLPPGLPDKVTIIIRFTKIQEKLIYID